MTKQKEYQSFIKKFGHNYSWWDIPAYIRKRDKMFEPIDKTAPYEDYMNNQKRNKRENSACYMERMTYNFDLRVRLGIEED